MIRYLIVLFFLKSFLFGCSLCSIYTPKTHVDTLIKADKENIKSVKITWTFADEFSKELLKLYDINLDKTFDEKELAIIQSYLIDYLKDRNFITTISYDKQINEKSNDFTVKNYKMNFRNSVLCFEYNIDLNYKIYDKNILNIRVFDNQGYFFIIFDPKKQLIHIPYKIKQQINLNDVSFTIDAPTQGLQEEKIQDEVIKENVENNEKKEVITTQTLSNEEIEKQNILERYTQNIKKYLLAVQNGEDKYALLFLLMASFIYGVIHSIGPGHGKALAFSYFTSQKSSYFQAFIISLATAFVHILGAFILVLISVVVLQSVMNRFLEDSISYITTFCAFVIMLLAIYIFYKKLTKKSCSCCTNLEKTTFTTTAKNINFVKTSLNKPIINENRNKKQDLIFVITAGIIPCPGTVLLFVYAFLLKAYFAVILASISISLGMAVIIFTSSFLGVSLNKVSSKSKKFVNILEIVSILFMFILALLLLLSSFNIIQR